MRILVIHCTYKYKGGEDTVLDEEIKLLRREGNEVELLLFSNVGNNLLKVLQMPFNLSSYLKTRKVIGSFEPDVVHLHNLHFAASPAVIYAIKNKKIPFVYTLHNYRLLCPSGTLFFNEKLFLNSIKQSFPWTAINYGVYKNSRLLTFWLALTTKIHQLIGTWKLVNKYIVLTNSAKHLLLNSTLQLQQNQIAIKPNFCAPAEVKSAPAGNHFLFIGRLTIEKGVSFLLKTFSALDFEIRIAGEGPLTEEVVKYSKLYPNIKFLGSLSKQDVFKELQSCSALIFPSIWFEGMPLVIIEAFACGIPVIASKLGAMESMIVPYYNGLHFEPSNELDLASKVEWWSKLDANERLAFGQHAKSIYDTTYSPKTNAIQLMNIYNSVLQPSH